jgi:hypothetical protein
MRSPKRLEVLPCALFYQVWLETPSLVTVTFSSAWPSFPLSPQVGLGCRQECSVACHDLGMFDSYDPGRH